MVAKMHRMHIAKVGEGVIYLPGGVPFEADDAPLPYPAGAFMRLGNKEFIYGIAGASLIPDVGAMNSLAQTIGNVAIAVKALAGATELKITSDVSILKDALVGGEVVVFPGPSNKAFTRGIIGNDAMTATATLTLQLDSPIPVEVVVSGSSAEVMTNPYSSLKENQGAWAMVMGMPTCIATVGQGLWIQVSGPSWAAPAGTVGALVNNQEAVFVGNGSLALRSTSGNENCQHAGVIICPAKAGTGQGAPFVMLQVAH